MISWTDCCEQVDTLHAVSAHLPRPSLSELGASSSLRSRGKQQSLIKQLILFNEEEVSSQSWEIYPLDLPFIYDPISSDLLSLFHSPVSEKLRFSFNVLYPSYFNDVLLALCGLFLRCQLRDWSHRPVIFCLSFFSLTFVLAFISQQMEQSSNTRNVLFPSCFYRVVAPEVVSAYIVLSAITSLCRFSHDAFCPAVLDASLFK